MQYPTHRTVTPLPAPASDGTTFVTPSGRYFASASDAAFWTRVERERAADYAARVAAYHAREAARARAGLRRAS